MEKIKEKVLGVENKIKEKLLKPKSLSIIFVLVIVLLAIFARYKMLQYKSPDYTVFLERWFNQIKELGGISALKYNIGDYNVPYITIMAILTYIPISPIYTIKAVSIFFDFVGAIFAGLLVNEFTKEKKNMKIMPYIVFAVILFLPTVLMDSALWGQCDMIYVSFILMSLYFLKKDKTIISFICLGIAFAFKLQFIFILPIYLLLYLRSKKISIFHFLIIPLVNFVMCLPALIMGRSLKDCIMIYFNQTGTYTSLTLNYPNLYNVFGEFFETQTTILIIFTLVILGIIAFYLIYKKVDIKSNMIKLGLLFALIMVYFLPRMHERYGFLAEILSIIYVATEKKNYEIPVILQLATISGYYSFLAPNIFNNEILILFSLLELAVIVKFTIQTLKSILQEGESNAKQQN